jgi:hypothetical protein
MSKIPELFNSSGLTGLLALAVLMPLQSAAADAACHSFLLQGEELIIDASSESLRSGSLARIISDLAANESLSVDFSAGQLCVEQAAPELAPSNSTPFAINLLNEELAVTAVIAGSTEVWLRLSPGYQSELLLERSIGEEIGLTDMEFLSDNSGVGAEDFFAEQIDYLELGSLSLDAPFADVPRFGVEYAHYEQSVNRAVQGFVATQGTLGLDLLSSLTVAFSPSQGLVLFSK